MSAKVKISFYDKAKGFLSFIANNTLELASQEEYERRINVCEQCKHYKAKGNLGLGECGLCGCTKLKLKLKRARCPKGKY